MDSSILRLWTNFPARQPFVAKVSRELADPGPVRPAPIARLADDEGTDTVADGRADSIRCPDDVSVRPRLPPEEVRQ